MAALPWASLWWNARCRPTLRQGVRENCDLLHTTPITALWKILYRPARESLLCLRHRYIIAPTTFLYAFLGERAPQTIAVFFLAFGLIIVAAALSAVQRWRQRRQTTEQHL